MVDYTHEHKQGCINTVVIFIPQQDKLCRELSIGDKKTKIYLFSERAAVARVSLVLPFSDSCRTFKFIFLELISRCTFTVFTESVCSPRSLFVLLILSYEPERSAVEFFKKYRQSG
jgi:hypothetical protein